MTALELLARLRELEVRVAAVDGELELDAPVGVLSAELRAEIVAHKPDLLKLLSWTRRSQRALAAPLEPAEREGELPLSWAQQRLWFLDQLEPGTAAYNIAWTVRLRGELDCTALQAAFDTLVQRHETLRTRFPGADGVPRQEVCRDLRVPLGQEQLHGAAAEKLRARLSAIAAQPFDLAEAPLIRATLLQLSASEHVLLVVMHHIVSDGASMRILFRELAVCYEAQLAGESPQLPPLPVQYVDYAVWQRRWLDSEEIEQQGHYWLQQLAGLPPLLELPWDRPRAAAQRFRGASVLRLLPASLAGDLRALGRQQGCTLYMVMLAAFFVLLHRYAGRDDLVLGTPMGGRSRTALEGLIGFFINTVVLRADLHGNPAFAELLQQIRSTALDAHANQDMPFEKLVEMLQPERELSYSPVFQVMFDLQEEPRWRLPVRNLEVIPEVIFSSRTASFDLTLSVRQAEHGLDAMFEYDTDLFDESSIEDMAAHYEALLEAIVRDVTQPILQLPLVAPDEQRQLEHRWIGAASDYPAATLPALFLQQVHQHPEAPALRDGERHFSYAELNQRAENLAQRLRAQGAGPTATVAVFARRSAAGVTATLAVLKSGACVMPLDPGWPDARIGKLLNDAGVSVLLAAPELATRAAGIVRGRDVVSLMLDEQCFLAPEPATIDCATPTHPDELAFLLYTSGTTGEPKGVELAHRGLVNYLHQLARETAVGAGDRVLQFASPAFDIAIEESLVALLQGAELVVRNEAMTHSLEDFAAACEAAGITWMSLPTAWWHELCAGFERDGIRLPASLRCVVIGGEKAEQEALRKWHRHAGRVRLFNTYGPTETSIAASWCELTHRDSAHNSDIPIGHPVPNVHIWVMDELRRPLPAGLPGELYIGGVGLARGYRDRPQLNAERFCIYTAADGTRHRLYRTGDRGRYLPDGRIAFLGRVDDQIKLRGHRIEPAEVEAVLGRLQGVDRCAVVPHGDGPQTKLVAYFSGTAEANGLLAQLRRELPDYMVPAVLLPVREWPFTANGKLNRAALPAPDLQASQEAPPVPPEGSVELHLAAIWSEVLGRSAIGRHDNFFSLGGHSLLATRVMARIRDELQQTVPLRALFDQPTVAGLATLIAAGRDRPRGLQLRQRHTQALEPLSWAQQRLWLVEQLQPGNPAYNLYSVNELRGALRLDCLQQALNTVVARHEILRTCFVEVNGEPMQTVVAGSRVDIQQHFVTAEGAALESRICELIDTPFDLHRGPLLRVHLAGAASGDVADEKYILVLVMHHIISDGWSLSVLYRELAAAYRQLCHGEAPELPPLQLQYADYAVWQRDATAAVEHERQLRYWREQLQDAPPLLALPTDRSRPATQNFAGGWVTTVFDRGLLQSLQQLAAAENSTLFMVLLAAFKVLLARQTGLNDLVVGTQLAGRRYSALEPLIGCFLNTLALRTRLGADPTLADVLHAVRKTALDAYEHQDVPFERLLDTLQVPRNTSYTPLVQVMFSLHNEPPAGLALEGMDSRSWLLNRAAPKFDLSVAMTVTSAGLRTGFEYNSDLFDAATVAEWVRQFGVLLEALATDPQQHAGVVHLADPPVYPRLQRSHRVLDPVATPTVAARFAAVLARYPERPAVVHGAECWSYRELAQRADAVAHSLQRAGIGAGTPVALLTGQDGHMLAALLGILKAGCYYVPLDAHAPAQRNRDICRAAAVRAVVTDAAHCAEAAGVRILADEPCAGIPQALALPELADDALAYVLFTSGSTGTPKGVLQSQANLLQHIDTYSAALGIEPDDRLSLLSSYGFDAAVMDIFAALLNGACLQPFDLGSQPPDVVVATLRDVTVLHATPTVFRLLTDVSQASTCFRQVRAVVLGGETATADDFEIFRRTFSAAAVFVNGYGPSESTLATQFFATTDTVLPGRQVPIGQPVAGTEVRLQTADGQPAAFSGEVVIASEKLALGYLNDAELTARQFSGGVYRTGDLARRLPDGQLVHRGRCDAQLKLRGYRIEPAEIEAAIKRVDGVRKAAVVLHEGRLTACVCGTADETAIRDRLRAELPLYMQPEIVVLLAQLPLRSNGKLDTGALPATSGRDRQRPLRLPQDELEQTVARVWSTLLECEAVGREDDFFALGGHSLLATRMLARVRQTTGVAVSLREFFAAPTVAALAAQLRAGQPAADAGGPLSIRLAAGELPPLSWSQQRLWFLDQLEPGNAAYNLHWAARLRGRLDVSALQAAIDDLVIRHTALRTAFVMHTGEPAQLQSAPATCPLQIELMPRADAGALRAQLIERVQQPFELGKAPLLRAYLLQLATDESVLLLVMHHIVSDGWSMGILFRELAACYRARLQGAPPELPSPVVDYGQYAAWQRTRLNSPELQRQAAYWRDRLEGIPPLLELPLDHPRPPVQRNRGAWLNRQFSPELLDAVRQLARQHGATVFMVLLAVFKVMVLRHTGREDIVVGAPVAGRERPELEGVVGYFLNTLVLRTQVDRDLNFSQLLGRVRATTLAAYEHQELPFEKLLEIVQPARSLAYSPLIQLSFNLHNEPGGVLELPELEVEVLPLDRGTSKYDLSAAAVESRNGLQLGFEYNTELFTADTVRTWLQHYGDLLESLVIDPTQSVARVPLSAAIDGPPARMAQGNAAGGFPLRAVDTTLAECFATVVDRYPERPAVQAGDMLLSYRELDERANALAAELLEVVPQQPEQPATVALVPRHDASMVVGLIAAIKAGLTYVPVDGHTPVARLERLLDAARVSVVLADDSLPAYAHLRDSGRVLLPLNLRTGQRSPSAPDCKVGPQSLAYVLFTSGSTGQPKGVMQTQRNVVQHIRTYSDALQITATDRVSLLASCAFDAAVMDIYGALLNGACLFPLDLRAEAYPGEVLDQMSEHQLTLLHATPTVFRHLMRSKVCRHELDSIRAVVLGGEEARAGDFELFRRQFAPPTLFVNGFGPSESTLATQFIATHATRLPGRVVPIGHPVAGTEVLLLDEQGNETELIGELAIRSPYVARGYWNEPQLTAGRFTPVDGSQPTWLYRSGDRARRLADGQYVFIGRVDDQLKVRGHRVEPAEVEAALLQYAGAERATVLLSRRSGSAEEPRLLAYVTGNEDVAAMRKALRAALPEYMLPAAIVPMETFPLLPNGKVDRNALPEPAMDDVAADNYVAPRNETEQHLAAIWSDVLGLQRVGVHDDFFELGGHSLLAAQLAARIHESMQVAVPMRRLFDTPTIADIATHVATLQWALHSGDAARNVAQS